MVQAVIQLIKGVGAEVVAEAVENIAQADILRAMGCDTVQGYIFAHPMFEDEYVAWIAQRRARRALRSLKRATLSMIRAINPRQRLDIRDRGMLADLVHRRIGQAEIDHRA